MYIYNIHVCVWCSPEVEILVEVQEHVHINPNPYMYMYPVHVHRWAVNMSTSYQSRSGVFVLRLFPLGLFQPVAPKFSVRVSCY